MTFSLEGRIATSKAKEILIQNGFFVTAAHDGHYIVGNQANNQHFKFTHSELLQAASALLPLS